MLQFILDIPAGIAVPALIGLRTLSIVIPPIQGWAIDAVAIVRLGWWQGLIVCEIGVLAGTSIAFFLAREFRAKLLSAKTNTKIDRLAKRFPEMETFWGLLVLRLLTNPLFDIISYAAGCTKISYAKFITASFLSTIPSMFAVFYFGQSIMRHGLAWGLPAIACIVLAWMWWRRRSTQLVDAKG
ncbi:MAG: VTT domain-containing protein [Patescibacteria group bacterium]